MGHTTINQKAAIAAETAVEVTATSAAMAEAHTTINQKVAAIVAEMAVKAAATVATVAEEKTAGEGAAATSAPIVSATTGSDNGRGKQQSTKSGRMAVVAAAMAAVMTAAMAAAVTAATAAAETKAAVAAATAAPTAAEAAADVAAMVAEALSWQRLRQLQLSS